MSPTQAASSVVRPGFLNKTTNKRRTKGSGPCLKCGLKDRGAQVSCSNCAAYICNSCHWCADCCLDLRICDVCERVYCRDCGEMDTCTECTSVHCKHCTSMDECAGCHQIFCMPGEGSPDADCAQECVGPGCDFVLCPSCAWFCQNCSAVLCEDCARSCGRCGVVVCAEDDKFLVSCEVCNVMYCLACMAFKEPCLKCSKVPGKRVQKMVHLRLKTIYQAMGESGNAAINARKPLFGPSSCNFSALSAAATAAVGAVTSGRSSGSPDAATSTLPGAPPPPHVYYPPPSSILQPPTSEHSGCGDPDCRHHHGEDVSALRSALSGTASKAGGAHGPQRSHWTPTPAPLHMDAVVLAKATVKAHEAEVELLKTITEEEQRQAAKKSKKKKKKGKKGKNQTVESPSASTAEAATAATEPEKISAESTSSSLVSTSSSSRAAPGVTTKPGRGDQPGLAARETDVPHSMVLAFIRSVIQGEVTPTTQDLYDHFGGRLTNPVITDVLAQKGNSLVDAVKACAEILCINLSKMEAIDAAGDAEANGDGSDVAVAAAEVSSDAQYDDENEEEDEEEEEEEEETEEMEGEGAVADHTEPVDPLDNKFRQAVAESDLESLQDLLEAVKGQPGHSSLRKSAKKHIKRIQQAQEEQKRRAQQQKVEQPSHGHSPLPTYSSYAPPRIAGQKPGIVMDLDVSIVGWVIGKSGARIKEMQAQSGAKMWVDQNLPDGRPLPDDTPRKLFIHGTESQLAAAKEQVTQLLKQAPGYVPPISTHSNSTTVAGAGEPAIPPPVASAARSAPSSVTPASSSSRSSRQQPADGAGGGGGVTAQVPSSSASAASANNGSERVTKVVDCPSNYVGLLIGRKGWTIKNIQQQSGAHVTVNQNVPEGQPRKIVLVGTPATVSLAESLVMDVLSYPADPPSAVATVAVAASSATAPEAPKSPVIDSSPLPPPPNLKQLQSPPQQLTPSAWGSPSPLPSMMISPQVDAPPPAESKNMHIAGGGAGAPSPSLKTQVQKSVSSPRNPMDWQQGLPPITPPPGVDIGVLAPVSVSDAESRLGGPSLEAIGSHKGSAASQQPVFRSDSGQVPLESHHHGLTGSAGGIGNIASTGGSANELWGAFSGLGSNAAGGGGSLSTILGLGSVGAAPLFPTSANLGSPASHHDMGVIKPPIVGDGFNHVSVMDMLGRNGSSSHSPSSSAPPPSMHRDSSSSSGGSAMADFLLSLGLEKYTGTFQQRGVALADLYVMKDQDLAHMGLPQAARSKIASALHRAHREKPMGQAALSQQQPMPSLDLDGIDDIIGGGPCSFSFLADM